MCLRPSLGHLLRANHINVMKFETDIEYIRAKILLHSPTLAAVTVVEQSPLGTRPYYNHFIYTRPSSQPKRGEQWLLKRIDQKEHAGVQFVRPNLKLKELLAIGAGILCRSLILLLRTASDRRVICPSGTQHFDQTLGTEKSSTACEGEPGRLLRLADQIGRNFASPILPEDVSIFLSNWAGLLNDLTRRKRGASTPSEQLLVDKFALHTGTCNYQPDASSKHVRGLVAHLDAYQFVQRGLLDVVEHLAGITDSIATQPQEWMPVSLPSDR